MRDKERLAGTPDEHLGVGGMLASLALIFDTLTHFAHYLLGQLNLLCML